MKKIILVLLMMVAVGYGQGKVGDHSDGYQGNVSHSYMFKLLNGDGLGIDPFDETEPFSIKETCGKCHSYDVISHGMHFNQGQTDDDGRPGQPWIYSDMETGTQIPMSYRKWEGVHDPQSLGFSPPKFTSTVGGFAPGNMVYDMDFDTDEPIRTDINCLSCHNADHIQSHVKYGMQIGKNVFSAAVAASSNIGTVTGDAFDVEVEYNPVYFDKKGQVNFDITRDVPNKNCLTCHSSSHIDKLGENRWGMDADVHIASGMNCVDCHRNGLDHATVRGYEGEKQGIENINAGTLSCAGCHMGQVDGECGSETPVAGRLGAPFPKHAGIPPIHMKKLACTACHSGRWPGEKVGLVKTSMIHQLGTLNSKKAPLGLPHVYSPIMTEGHDEKLGPHKMIWPAFWAWKGEGDELKVIMPDRLKRALRGDKAFKFELDMETGWILEENIIAGLTILNSEDKEAVYISNGKMHSVKDGKLVSAEHKMAEPYKWAEGHNVRPVSQSLGNNGECGDCHTTDAGFFFGKVPVDGPVKTEDILMADMQESIDGDTMRAFNASFIFRPMMKYFSLLCTAVLAVVLLGYALKALSFVFAVFCGKIPIAQEEKAYEFKPIYEIARNLVYPVIWLLTLVLAGTGFVGCCGGAGMKGWSLMVHCTAAPMFLAFVTLAVILRAADNRFVKADIGSFRKIAGKACFWIMIAIVIVVTLSSVVCMFPIFGTCWQGYLVHVHQWASAALVTLGVLHLMFVIKK